MTKQYDGGQAFPGICGNSYYSGMTIRDYFASNAPFTLDEYKNGLFNKCFNNIDEVFKDFCELRFKYADAMLKARES